MAKHADRLDGAESGLLVGVESLYLVADRELLDDGDGPLEALPVRFSEGAAGAGALRGPVALRVPVLPDMQDPQAPTAQSQLESQLESQLLVNHLESQPALLRASRQR